LVPVEDQRVPVLCGPSADHRTRRATLELAFGVRPAEQGPPPDHRPSVRLPVVDNADIHRVTRMVTETQRVRVRLPWDDQRMRQTTAVAGLDRLGKAMAAAYGLDRLGKTMTAAHRKRMRPLFDTQELVGSMFGGEFERIAQAMADAYRAPVRPRFDVQGVVEVAQGLADATIAVSSTATTGSLAVVDGSVPARAPLFPGLMDSWEQVRFWDLQAWITFLAFLVAVAGLLVAIGQSRPQVGLSPEELEKVIRIIQEHQKPKTSTSAPNSSTAPTRSKPTRPLDGEKGHVPTVRPSPTSG
jgi:hypothetical protein